MPEIQVRPAVSADTQKLAGFDHSYDSDFSWQMDIQHDESGEISIKFRPIRLPRSVKVAYPRTESQLQKEFKNLSGILVACFQDEEIGYIRLVRGLVPATTWGMDLAVKRAYRRQGVATVLVLAAQEWAKQHKTQRFVLEMQSKNHPAICLAQKLGFDFCGYNDRYYLNRDIAFFYVKSV